MEPSEWPADPAERIILLVEAFLDQLDLDGDVEIEEDENTITATVVGDEDYGLLIGRHGQTIDALQLICFQAAFQGVSERKRVTLDAAGYRERREEIVTEKADRAAEKALATDSEIEMVEMNARERRIVHEHLKGNPEIETFSTGDEPRRRVVVAPLIQE